MKTLRKAVLCPEPPSSVPAGLFSDFEITGRKRPGAFIAGYGIQLIAVAVLLTITLTASAPVFMQKKYSTISLVAPTLSVTSLERHPTARISPPQSPVISPASPENVAPIPIPAPPPVRVERLVDIPAAPKPAPLPSVVEAVPTTPVAKPVQTGSFGDHSGTSLQRKTSPPSRAPSLAALGSFGTPTAVTGRQAGREVATGAFVTVSSASGQSSKAVKKVEFTEPAQAKVQPVLAKASSIAPVVIQSKPVPVYTEEARRLRLEGDVVVQVVFTATGEIRIVGVVKGLGHGLDEAALAATRQIRFTPARRDGQFVDYPATIHVVFALS